MFRKFKNLRVCLDKKYKPFLILKLGRYCSTEIIGEKGRQQRELKLNWCTATEFELLKEAENSKVPVMTMLERIRILLKVWEREKIEKELEEQRKLKELEEQRKLKELEERQQRELEALKLEEKIKLRDIQTELKKKGQTIQTELKEEGQTIQTELKKEGQTIQTELKEEGQTIQTELKGEGQTIQTELKEEGQTIQQQREVEALKLEEQIKLMYCEEVKDIKPVKSMLYKNRECVEILEKKDKTWQSLVLRNINFSRFKFFDRLKEIVSIHNSYFRGIKEQLECRRSIILKYHRDFIQSLQEIYNSHSLKMKFKEKYGHYQDSDFNIDIITIGIKDLEDDSIVYEVAIPSIQPEKISKILPDSMKVCTLIETIKCISGLLEEKLKIIKGAQNEVASLEDRLFWSWRWEDTSDIVKEVKGKFDFYKLEYTEPCLDWSISRNYDRWLVIISRLFFKEIYKVCIVTENNVEIFRVTRLEYRRNSKWFKNKPEITEFNNNSYGKDVLLKGKGIEEQGKCISMLHQGVNILISELTVPNMLEILGKKDGIDVIEEFQKWVDILGSFYVKHGASLEHMTEYVNRWIKWQESYVLPYQRNFLIKNPKKDTLPSNFSDRWNKGYSGHLLRMFSNMELDKLLLHNNIIMKQNYDELKRCSDMGRYYKKNFIDFIDFIDSPLIAYKHVDFFDIKIKLSDEDQKFFKALWRCDGNMVEYLKNKNYGGYRALKKEGHFFDLKDKILYKKLLNNPDGDKKLFNNPDDICVKFYMSNLDRAEVIIKCNQSLVDSYINKHLEIKKTKQNSLKIDKKRTIFNNSLKIDKKRTYMSNLDRAEVIIKCNQSLVDSYRNKHLEIKKTKQNSLKIDKKRTIFNNSLKIDKKRTIFNNFFFNNINIRQVIVNLKANKFKEYLFKIFNNLKKKIIDQDGKLNIYYNSNYNFFFKPSLFKLSSVNHKFSKNWSEYGKYANCWLRWDESESKRFTKYQNVYAYFWCKKGSYDKELLKLGRCEKLEDKKKLIYLGGKSDDVYIINYWTNKKIDNSYEKGYKNIYNSYKKGYKNIDNSYKKKRYKDIDNLYIDNLYEKKRYEDIDNLYIDNLYKKNRYKDIYNLYKKGSMELKKLKVESLLNVKSFLRVNSLGSEKDLLKLLKVDSSRLRNVNLRDVSSYFINWESSFRNLESSFRNLESSFINLESSFINVESNFRNLDSSKLITWDEKTSWNCRIYYDKNISLLNGNDSIPLVYLQNRWYNNRSLFKDVVCLIPNNVKVKRYKNTVKKLLKVDSKKWVKKHKETNYFYLYGKDNSIILFNNN